MYLVTSRLTDGCGKWDSSGKLHFSATLISSLAYVCGSGRASVKAAEHLLKVVLGVGGQCISTAVDADRCSSRDVVIEFDVRRLSQVELHVPVAVRVDGLGQFLTQLDL